MVTDYITKREKVCSLHLQELKRRQAVENPCWEVLNFVSVENPATKRTEGCKDKITIMPTATVCKDTGHCCTHQQSVRPKDTAAHTNSL